MHSARFLSGGGVGIRWPLSFWRYRTFLPGLADGAQAGADLVQLGLAARILSQADHRRPLPAAAPAGRNPFPVPIQVAFQVGWAVPAQAPGLVYRGKARRVRLVAQFLYQPVKYHFGRVPAGDILNQQNSRVISSRVARRPAFGRRKIGTERSSVPIPYLFGSLCCNL